MQNFRRFKVMPLEKQQQIAAAENLLPPPPKRIYKVGYKGRRNMVQVHAVLDTQPTGLQEMLIPKVTTRSLSVPQNKQQVESFAPEPLKSQTPLKQQAAIGNDDKLSPGYVLAQYSHQLSNYELTEINQYTKIYFWGQNAQKRYNPENPNNGFDDKAGEYLGTPKDHVAYRYELISVLGQGSFGKVYKAYDHHARQTVAIKIVKNKKRFHRQGLVEVRLLETLRKNDPEDIANCVKLTHSFYFRSHLCIVFEMLSLNLYELLVKFSLKGLKMNYVKHIVLQCLNALCYAENLTLIHADIKPENILLVRDTSTHIKVIDWGSGAFVGQTIYSYIQSRYYRAPEVILGLPYSIEIDTWSMGCVFAELITGLPLFSGEDEHDQLGKICEFLGMPPQDMIEKSPRISEFFLNGKLRTKHRISTKSLQQHLRGAPNDLIDLISQMLQWDPAKRATPHKLMNHPYVLASDIQIPLVKDLGVGAVDLQVEKKELQEQEKTSEMLANPVVKQSGKASSSASVAELPSIWAKPK